MSTHRGLRPDPALGLPARYDEVLPQVYGYLPARCRVGGEVAAVVAARVRGGGVSGESARAVRPVAPDFTKCGLSALAAPPNRT